MDGALGEALDGESATWFTLTECQWTRRRV